MTIEKADLEKFLRERKTTLKDNLAKFQKGQNPLTQFELGLIAKTKEAILDELAEKFGIDLKTSPKKEN